MNELQCDECDKLYEDEYDRYREFWCNLLELRVEELFKHFVKDKAGYFRDDKDGFREVINQVIDKLN